MTIRFVLPIKTVLFTIASGVTFLSMAEIIQIGCAADFDAAISRGKPYVIEIYSTTCPACRNAEKPLKELLSMRDYVDINLLKVEGYSRVFPYVSQKLQGETISGYPTFIFFHANGTKFYKMTGFDVTNFKPRLDEMNAKHMPTQQAVPKKQKRPQHHDQGDHHDTHHKGRGHHTEAYHANVHAKKQTAPVSINIKKQACPAVQQTTTKVASEQQELRGQLIHLNSIAQLDELKKAHSKLVLIFSTSWCGPCKQMKPTYQQMAAQYASVPFVYVDGDSAIAGKLKGTYKVTSYPHVVFINNKGAKLGELPGACDPSVAHSAFSGHLGK